MGWSASWRGLTTPLRRGVPGHGDEGREAPPNDLCSKARPVDVPANDVPFEAQRPSDPESGRARSYRCARSFGAIRPQPIATRMRIAVAPSPATMGTSVGDAVSPSCAIWTMPAVTLKRNTPGMNETTAAKPSAAYGSRRRLATGVTITPTKRQARNAAEAAVAPSEIADHRRPWATIPTTIGIASGRHRIE